MLKTCFQVNDKVVFISGNDLTDHEKPDKNRTMKLPKACTPDQVARELKLLPGAKKTADTCGIPSRADLDIVLPKAIDLLRQSHTNYVFVGTSEGLHCVNDRNGIHLKLATRQLQDDSGTAVVWLVEKEPIVCNKNQEKLIQPR